MFNKQELEVLQQFLSRVDLKGSESETHVYMTRKINVLINQLESEEGDEEAETEEEDDGNPTEEENSA